MWNKYHVGLIIGIVIIISWAFAWPFRISGDCMEPAVKDGQLRFLNRTLPYVRPYQIGDIILFMHEEKVWISRIVALESSMVEIVAGNVVVNGAILQDSVDRDWSHWKHGTYAIEKPFKVPLDHVYVLSDKLSADHDDSRVFGPVSKKTILGLVWTSQST